jgi:hypothetical protein
MPSTPTYNSSSATLCRTKCPVSLMGIFSVCGVVWPIKVWYGLKSIGKTVGCESVLPVAVVVLEVQLEEVR